MPNASSILVVDDELMIREAVSSYLQAQGYHVLTAENGRDALQLMEQRAVSFVILDLMLPDLSGEEVCRTIRKKSRVPIIMLTAKTKEQDMLTGLEIGADDYIMKPFSLKNLHARMQAIARRSAEDLKALTQKFSWNNGDLVIDYHSQEVFKNGQKVTLTPSEWKILSALTKYPQRIFSRDELLSISFDQGFDGYDRIIDTHVKNLRRKIEDDSRKPAYIRTVYGMGYRFGGEQP